MIPFSHSYVICHPDSSSVMRRNRRHLRIVTSLNRVEIPDEPELDLELESQTEDLNAESPDAEPDTSQQIAKPSTAMMEGASSASVQPCLPEVRTFSGRVVRKPARFRDFFLMCF